MEFNGTCYECKHAIIVSGNVKCERLGYGVMPGWAKVHGCHAGEPKEE